MELKWTDIEDLALALFEAHPDVDPLTVRFTELRDWISQLEDWSDDIHKSNEAKLEAIQMAWLDEYKSS